jgi:hypothetical protein
VLRGVSWPPLMSAGLLISSGRFLVFRLFAMIWLWCWRLRRSRSRRRPFCLLGRRVAASGTAKLLARAFDRVEARHRLSDPGAELSFEVLLAGGRV